MMNKTLLSPHFSLEEFTYSETALRMGVDNSLPAELMDNARATAMMLERIRVHLISLCGHPVPIVLTSGYRCPQVNRAVGSKDTSDHRQAMAADARAPDFGTPLQVCQALAPAVSLLNIGQLIYEFGSWFHVSTRIPDKAANRVITINKNGTFAGIVE
jgi:zinc D-Ala-D-Ala carboxypeptidase